MEEQRESLSSRLGFILLSAGCAIGIGNVYKFPIMTGHYGGGFFVLFYLIFLIILGIPLITMELAVGRASQKSLALSFDTLEKPKHKWHLWKWGGLVGNYVLMMCYLVIVGWIAIYFIKYIDGSVMNYTTIGDLELLFNDSVSNTGINIAATFTMIIIGFGICAIGLKNGVEKVSKVMMLFLLLIIIGLVIYSLTLSGAKEGVAFYLVPSVDKLKEAGIFNTISAAMCQAFFTLSIGIGAIAIFGSYIGKERSLANEGLVIILLDTMVAILCGFIIFPACYTYEGGVFVGEGVSASFIFTTFSAIFNTIGGVGGRIFGIVFFLLLLFAAFSTVLAVFENIIGFWQDSTKLKRPIICLINILIFFVLAIPGILGNSVWSGAKIAGLNIMDMEDNLVSKIILPLGCLVYCVFCTQKFGWGMDNFLTEANTGKGLKLIPQLKIYYAYILPLIILFVIVMGFINI